MAAPSVDRRVSGDARAQVFAAARRLGYPGPHPGARSLRRRRTSNLGVVLGERLTYAFDDPQATRFLAGVADVCTQRGLGLMLVPVCGDASDASRVAQASVDAFVVWTTADDDPVVDAVATTRLPAVVHGGPARTDMGLVAADDYAAARAVGREAFAGSRRRCVLSFPLDRARHVGTHHGLDPDAATFRVTRERLRGLRDAARDVGVDWSEVQIVVCARNDTHEAETAAEQLLSGPGAPDAIAAMSDELALGVLRAARRVHVGVPQDLIVTGWDDTDAAAAAALTTIRQDLRAQGARSARLALGDPPVDLDDTDLHWHLDPTPVLAPSHRGEAEPDLTSPGSARPFLPIYVHL